MTMKKHTSDKKELRVKESQIEKTSPSQENQQAMVGFVQKQVAGPIPSAEEMSLYRRDNPELADKIAEEFQQESRFGRKAFYFHFAISLIVVLGILGLAGYFIFVAYQMKDPYVLRGAGICFAVVVLAKAVPFSHRNK